MIHLDFPRVQAGEPYIGLAQSDGAVVGEIAFNRTRPDWRSHAELSLYGLDISVRADSENTMRRLSKFELLRNGRQYGDLKFGLSGGLTLGLDRRGQGRDQFYVAGKIACGQRFVVRRNSDVLFYGTPQCRPGRGSRRAKDLHRLDFRRQTRTYPDAQLDELALYFAVGVALALA